MKYADLHMHTCYSHGENTPFEMHAAAQKRGLSLIGFTEHSPRPIGYDYTREYRAKLERYFPSYIKDVCSLKEHTRGTNCCQVLLGLEMDWFPNEVDFIKKACVAYPYDYIIGSVHFIDKWGFDDRESDWEKLNYVARCEIYEKYFCIWRKMLESHLFQIAAHPDLIKIFSVNSFNRWLKNKHSRDLIEECLLSLRDANMAMEISSAGLRKPCNEIYPAPAIMEIAKKIGVRITLASDAHKVEDVGRDFSILIDYARDFGFNTQSIFKKKEVWEWPL